MKMKLYSVLDTKLGAFGGIFMELRDEGAIRSFFDSVNDSSDKNNRWNRHPEDFALYNLGEFDQETGMITPNNKLCCIVTAASLKKDDVQLDMFNSKNGFEAKASVIN